MLPPLPHQSLSNSLHVISSPELPLLTSDVIRHAANSEGKSLGGSVVQQLQRSGGFVGRPSVMVCHAHGAVWKETIDAVCKFCRYRAFFLCLFLFFKT